MSRLLLTAAVLAILVYAMVLGVRWLTPRIEQDIADRVTTSLAEQGLLWADVTVKGRQVTLSGEAPSGESHDKAVAAASKVFGVAKVDDQLMVAGDASATTIAKAKVKKSAAPYVLSITKDGEDVVISGEVSSEADKAVLQRLATTHYGEGHVNVDGVKVVEGAPAGWRTAAGTVLFNIFNMEKAVATLSDTEVMVSGTVVDQQFSDQMEQAVKATLPESYKVAFAVDVVTPTVTADIQPAAGEPASSATCANVEEIKKERLRFDFDKAQLKSEHTAILKRVADKLEGCSNQHVVLAGFTDQTGSPLYNKWLSQQRAEAALRGLMRDGVGKDRLQAVGYGEKHPEVSNTTREGRALNRRVEFHPGDKLPYAEVAPAAAPAKKVVVKGKTAEKKIEKPWWAEKGAAAPADEVKHEVPTIAPKAKTDEAGLVN